MITTVTNYACILLKSFSKSKYDYLSDQFASILLKSFPKFRYDYPSDQFCIRCTQIILQIQVYLPQ